MAPGRMAMAVMAVAIIRGVAGVGGLAVAMALGRAMVHGRAVAIISKTILYAQEDCNGWNIGPNNQPWITHNQISTEITTTVRIERAFFLFFFCLRPF